LNGSVYIYIKIYIYLKNIYIYILTEREKGPVYDVVRESAREREICIAGNVFQDLAGALVDALNLLFK